MYTPFDKQPYPDTLSVKRRFAVVKPLSECPNENFVQALKNFVARFPEHKKKEIFTKGIDFLNSISQLQVSGYETVQQLLRCTTEILTDNIPHNKLDNAYFTFLGSLKKTSPCDYFFWGLDIVGLSLYFLMAYLGTALGLIGIIATIVALATGSVLFMNPVALIAMGAVFAVIGVVSSIYAIVKLSDTYRAINNSDVNEISDFINLFVQPTHIVSNIPDDLSFVANN